jgi:hypothetical protein
MDNSWPVLQAGAASQHALIVDPDLTIATALAKRLRLFAQVTMCSAFADARVHLLLSRPFASHPDRTP